MNREIQKIKGTLADLEQRKKDLEIRLSGYVTAMRENLYPMQPVYKLPADIIFSQAVDLAARHSEYMEVLAEIEKAKDLLGR